RMTTNEQYLDGYNPGLATGETLASPGLTNWDASVGLSFNSSFGDRDRNNMFAGVAMHHLNRPKNSFYRDVSIELEPRWVYSAGVRLGVDEYSAITIQADHSRQARYTETLMGFLYS